MTQRILAFALASMVLTLSGCVPFRKRKVAAAPPTLPPTQTAKAPSKPEVPPPPPKVDTTQPKPTVPAAVAKIPAIEEVPGPPVPKVQKPKRRSIKAQQVAPPPTQAETPAEAPAGPTAAVQLGDFLSDEQRARLLSDANDNMLRARKVLAQIEGRPLNTEQQDSVERVKTFIQQAEQARERDPRTAVQLAQRADVLARDLAKVIR